MKDSLPIAGRNDLTSCIKITNPVIKKWAQDQLLTTLPIHPTDTSKLVIYGDDFCDVLQIGGLEPSVSKTKIALCLTGECSSSYLDLFRVNVRHIVFPHSPFADDALRLAVSSATSIVQPEQPYLEFKVLPVDDKQDQDGIASATKEFLVRHGFGFAVNNALIALHEAMTNAIFHSFREAKSHDRKYTTDNFSRMLDGDSVTVELKVVHDWVSITVRDNSGSLGPLSVANSLDRHRSNHGLMDARGRGFYLMRHITDRMVINLNRGVETSIELYFLRNSPGKFRRHLELVEH